MREQREGFGVTGCSGSVFGKVWIGAEERRGSLGP